MVLQPLRAIGSGKPKEDPKDFPGDPALAGYDPASIRCEVAYYPATDFTDITLAGRFLGRRARIMFGGSAKEKEAVIRLLSPAALSAKSPRPFTVFTATRT